MDNTLYCPVISRETRRRSAKAVREMDMVVQRNTASTEEAALAWEDMSAHAYQINEIVGVLRSLVEGSKSRPGGRKGGEPAPAGNGEPEIGKGPPPAIR